ncbi:procathepsin L-like [Oppia nitens]|uniref:procathepsin L-like n=1 Tax=Oppia nitens TaxID=1686743 RepID=UPI0023DAF043|nr:procathepsin L-like [Oppia nitens]
MKSSIGLVIQLSLVLLLLVLNLSNQSLIDNGLPNLPQIQAPVSLPVVVNQPNIPAEWDWRKYGIVTPARNQGACGSGWSLSSAEALESHLMKVQIAEGKFDPKKQLSLSEQNLIDCSRHYGTEGCNGGSSRDAFKYVNQTKGLNTNDDYPYTGKDDSCHYNKEKRVDIDIKEIKRITTGSDQELVSAIYTYGPVTVAVHLTNKFLNYSSGILDDITCNAEQISGLLLAVGYTPEYFILKNNWGTKWGENGFVRLSRSKVNNCGVSEQAYYPVLANDVGTDKIRDKLKEVK